MSYNGSGTFVVNSSGQPVVTGTVISSTAFNALTADLATGLSTCVTKDGQTATTVRVPFAFGINSTLTTDATSTTTGSIITAGGISTQKALFVGTTSNFAGTITAAAATFSGLITASAGVSSTLTTDATSATTGSIITAGGISTQKALWVGTTSRHVGAATFDSTIASGAITSTGKVTALQTLITGNISAASWTTSGLRNITAASTLTNTTSSGTVANIYADLVNATALAASSSTTYTRAYGLVLGGVSAGSNVTITEGFALACNGSALIGALDFGNSYGYFGGDNGARSITIGGTNTGGGQTFSYVGSNIRPDSSGAGNGIVRVSAGFASGIGFETTSSGVSVGTGTIWTAATSTAGSSITKVSVLSWTTTGALTANVSVTAPFYTATATGTNGLGLAAAGTPAIYVNGTTEAARFTTTGGLLVGTTGVPNGTSIYGSALVPVSFDRTRLCMAASSTSSLELVQFFNPNGQVGSISTSGSATAYTTSSDYRLKENVQPMTGGLATVAALKPVTYDWIRTGFAGEGFIAHELQAVIPAAVSGEKDAVDDKGEIEPQGVDFGKIVPHLVAAIQELTTRLAALENK